MSDSSPRLGLPDLPDTPELYADTVADAFARIDAFSDLYLKGQFVNDPPSSPADGDAYLIGGSPTGDWSGYAYKVATCRDGAWTKLAPFNGLRAYVATTGSLIVYVDGAWLDWDAMISAAETSIASAATCDLGAAGSLFLEITGTTAITSFGTAANRLRFVRFAGALTLTHDAASLILPGAADIVTAVGDTAIFASDAGGNWRCRCYSRADGRMVDMASPTFTGTLAAAAANVSGTVTQTISTGTYQTLNATGADGAVLDFQNSGVDYAYIGSSRILITGGAMGNFAIRSQGALDFSAGGAALGARLGTDGSLLVGVTANGGFLGNAIGEFRNVDNVLTAYSTAAGSALTLRVDTTYLGLGYLVNLQYGGAQVGTITTNGTAAAYNTTSDARLKTVLPQQANHRDAIRALWVGDFTWTQSGAPGFGVLAQQAYDVMPNHQGVSRPAQEDGTWQASAEPFGHLALWGVKDLYAMLETLTARVAALEAAHDAG